MTGGGGGGYNDYVETGNRGGGSEPYGGESYEGGRSQYGGRGGEYAEGRGRDYRGGSGTSLMKTLMQQVEEQGGVLDRDMGNYVLEDTRLSTLQKKLTKESERTVALALSLHINDCLLLPENATYVARSSEIIQDGILEVLRSRDHSPKVRELCSIALGRVGSLNPNFSGWGASVWKIMEATEQEDLKALFISSFSEAIARGGGTQDGIEALIGLVKGLLEDTQSEVLVIALLEVMNTIAFSCPHHFKNVFTEVVDIAVGWFMESGNLPDVRKSIGKHIIAWSNFWKEEVGFGVDQVGFYIEDLLLETRTGGEDEDLQDLEDDEVSVSILQAFQYKWGSAEYDDEEKEKSQTQTISFLQMIDCVLTGLSDTNPVYLNLPKVGVWLHLVRNVSMESLSWRWSEDLAISGLRCMMSCLKIISLVHAPLLADKENIVSEFICYLAKQMNRFSVAGQRVLIFSLQELFSVNQENLSMMIYHFIGREGHLMNLAVDGSHECILNDTINLLHSLLNLKNVIIMQNVYLLLMERYEKALYSLANVKPFLESNTYSVKMHKITAKKMVMFVLAAIGNIATTKGSLLSMWALDPSIFEVLSQHSGLHNTCLAVAHPAIHHSILRLLLLHSSTHSFYQSSSTLLGSTSASPTSQHLTNLLNSLSTLISWSATSQSVKSLALKYMYTILVSLKPSGDIFVSTEVFESIFKSCIKLLNTSHQLIKDILRIFLFIVEEFILSSDKLQVLAHCVLQSFQHADDSCKQMSLRLLSRIPLSIMFKKTNLEVLKQFGVSKDFHRSILERVMRREYSADDISGAEVNEYFQYIGGDGKNVSWLDMCEIFGECDDYHISGELKATCLAWVSAQYCVLNKLKSPVGKAQDTLGHIDVTCRRLANQSSQIIDINQAQGLLHLVHYLEKCMLNAWDGSLGSLPTANKSASLFFYANKKTCKDWLERVRGNLMRIAYTVGNYSEVVRHAWALLPILLKKGDIESVSGMNLILLTCLALAKLKAPANIQGIFMWAREVSRSKFKWIPGISELGRDNTESGVKSIQGFLSGTQEQVHDKSEEMGQLLPALGELVWKGHLALYEYDEYFAWVKTYHQTENTDNSAGTPGQNKYLIALSQFQDGVIPSVVDGLEPDHISNHESIVDNTLDSIHINLLQAGLQIQKSYMKSNSNWNDNSQLNQALSSANTDISKILKMVDITGAAQSTGLVYNAIWQEINCIKNKGTSQVNLVSGMTGRSNRSSILLLLKRWLEFLARYRKNPQDIEDELVQLNLEICKAARRENNLHLSSRHLLQSFSAQCSSLAEYVNTFDIFSAQLTGQNAAILRQACKTLLASDTNSSEIAVSAISGVALSAGQVMLTLRYDESMGQLLQESSRALLNLTSALQADSALFEKVYPDPKSVKLDAATITQVLQVESIIPPSRETLQKTIPLAEVASENDLVIGRLLRLSVLQDPSLSKGWNKLADWAYQMGQQVVENAAKSNNKVPLTPEELETLDKLIPNIAESSKKKIINIISQVKLKDSHLAGYEYEKWDFMRRDLREVNALMSVDDDIFQGIIGLWISVFRRTYALYDLAGEAYFKYLSLCGETPASGTISASLRLLHLTVNHTMELQDIQLGLSKTPSTQWKAIIPQLFSRLNHAVPVVRQRISDLLCRISAKYPELIIFPAVVGSLTTGAQTSETLTNIFSGTLLNKETAVTSDQETEGQSNVLMLSAHQKIVEELKKVMPTAVEQVSSFVSELRRITLLWDELWLGTLAQYSGEVQRRINRFEQESGRLESNSSLTVEDKLKLVKDKYNIVFTPIIYVLDQVAAITKSSPETPHEEEFQRKYGSGIDTLLEGIKNPEDWGTPCKAWSYLPQLQARLNNRVNKKSALKLAEISPSLYSMRNTEIMMPGDLGGKEHSVQIARFEGTMTVLPTKTKPKKFSLIGTDGGRYTYLFKGLEDLHLDERIMQFLGIANQMLSKNKRERDVKYFARNYTVIPLGSRSGLIQWVEGAMPIFALYKRWQLRQHQHLENAKKLEDAAKIVGKPSDIFYAKILPILRKHGVSKIEDRKSWPISLLKQVLQELVQETPRDLLGNQVWLRSVSGEQWWKIIQNLGRSFAVMSIIGYIIGLGDRHLDNILVNLDQGYVVHIDYNICFEKGKILRIPERVPCRLTQNIVSVLGVSGVEGLFRLGCERTLSVMREERETLLTLLEAFVYDPLVDWTTGITGGLAGAMYGGGGAQEENEKREMEHSLTFSMLGVRVTEMKGAWLENKHDLQAALMQVDEGLSSWQELVTISQKNGEQLSALHTNMSTLKEAEVNPGHRLYSIIDTYRKQKAVEGGVDVVKNQLQSFISECDKILTLYNRATASVSGPQLSKWDHEAGRLLEQNQILSSRTVSTFLENAGQREQLAQYGSVEKDMRMRMTGLLDELKRILEDLHIYAALTSLYPASMKEQHRIHKYSGWGNTLLESKETFRVEVIDGILSDFASLFSPQGVAGPERVEQVRVMNLALEKEHQETLLSVQKLYQRMMSENLMKPGRTGILEEMARNRDSMLNQLNHPDSGLRPDTLICFFLQQLVQVSNKWIELDKGIVEEPEGGRVESMVEGVLLQSGVTNSLLNTMELLNLGSSSDHLQVLEALNHTYSGLRDLETSFTCIILPEGIKKNLQGEPSVLEVCKNILNIISTSGVPLEEIKHELRLHTRCMMLGMESPHTATVQLVHEVRKSFTKLLSAAVTADNMSTGQMLLCAINTLFDKVDYAMVKLREKVISCSSTTEYSNFNTILAAQDISTAAFNTTPGVWESMALNLFICKLELMEKFFNLSQSFSSIFNLNSIGSSLPLGQALLKPVKKFILDFVKGFLVGTGPRHLTCAIAHFAQDCSASASSKFLSLSSGKLDAGDLVQAVYDEKLGNGYLNQARIAKMTVMTKSMMNAIQRWEMIQQLETAVERMNAQQKLNCLLYASLQWYFQELLPVNVKAAEPSRVKFLPGITGRTARVFKYQAELQELSETFVDLKGGVDQRLKWAVGANPQLQEVVEQFSSEHSAQVENIRLAGLLVKSVTGIVHAAVQYELLRTKTPEAQASDHQFLNILSMARESAGLNALQRSTGLSEDEMSLLDMNPPQEGVDKFWIKQTEEIIAKTVRSIQDQVTNTNKQCNVLQKRLSESALAIKDLLTVHHKLMADVAVLLRTILKIENLEFPGISVYLSRYKEFTDDLNKLMRSLLSDNVAQELGDLYAGAFDRVKSGLNDVYNDLVNIAGMARDENLVQELLKNRKMKEEDPKKDDQEVDDNSAAKKVEERNKFAVNVLKRVRLKLEGREPDSLRKSSVAEQVDFVIRESTTPDNLALMYEGWTAWI